MLFNICLMKGILRAPWAPQDAVLHRALIYLLNITYNLTFSMLCPYSLFLLFSFTIM